MQDSKDEAVRAAVATIPRWTRKQAAAALGLDHRYCSRLCRRHLEGAMLLSDLDIAVLKGRDTKTGPKGPRGQPAPPPTKRELEEMRAAAWARIIDPAGILEQHRKEMDIQAARKEAARGPRQKQREDRGHPPGKQLSLSFHKDLRTP